MPFAIPKRAALMSALGQKLPQRGRVVECALPPIADIRERDWDVRFGPGADDWCDKGSLFRGRDITRIHAEMSGPSIRR